MSIINKINDGLKDMTALEKGDKSGHEFYGNQHKAGAGAQSASKDGRMHMDSLKEGQKLYDKKGQKVDEVAAVSNHPFGGKRVDTRAGLSLHANRDGVNAHGYTNVKPGK